MRLPHTFVRLPLEIDAERLAAEVAAIPEDQWRDHPEGAPGNTALPLVALNGDPDNNRTEGPMRPTSSLSAMPYTRQVLAALGATIGRTRLMRIDTETELKSHVDTNYYWWSHLRIHVPIRTTPDVEFAVEDESVHMAAGEVWVFDTWRPHRVNNPASSPRIHLVIDAVGSSRLWNLIDNPEQDPIRIDFRADQNPGFPLESWNWPLVMSADEVDQTIEQLLSQVAAPGEPAAQAASKILHGFARDWRDLWARIGLDPAGWSLREMLREQTRAQLAQLGAIRLDNNVLLQHAMGQLVLSPCLASEQQYAARSAALLPAEVVARLDGAVVGAPATSMSTAPAPARPSTGAPAEDGTASPVARPTPASTASAVEAMLAGPPRLVDPIFIVCPPRSGSSFFFETLARSPELYTIGGESHTLIEGIPAFTPQAHDWSSNRLDASDAKEGLVSLLKERFVMQLRDRDGAERRFGELRMLEKTPKNALRVPFLAEAFPDAKFIYLYRDPRETVSSMLDAWRSGRFITYRDLPSWNGSPWSLLLTPGWRDLIGRPLAEVVASQWATTVNVLLDDLEALDPDRWVVASYDRLVSEPLEEIMRLCDYLDIEWDDDLSEPLPNSRHTLESPHPEKWRRNATELEPILPIIAPAAERAREMFATPPRVQPVQAGESADRARRRKRPTPVTAPVAGGADGPAGEGGTAPAPALNPQELFGSRHTKSFRALLEATNSTLLITTYQAGRLIMVRPTPDGINTHFRGLKIPMGITYKNNKLAIGTQGEVLVFQNQPDVARRLENPEKYDGCFVPRARYLTGDIRVHDLGWGDEGIWVVNTRFSCLATLDADHSFVPRWQPPFITKLAAEDRCHLNGLTMKDGKPKYVTVLGISDEEAGWRENKAEGGAIIDVDTNAIVTHGLSMPHSPRLHDGKLWVLESGVGALSVVDESTGTVERVAQVPGFARGLTFVGQYAIIGLSRVREHIFDGLPLTRDAREELQCGIWVVDTTNGEIVAHMAFEGLVQEIFDVALLPGLRFPELIEPGAPLADSAFIVPPETLAAMQG